MRIIWSSSGWEDVERLYAFLAEYDVAAANAVFDQLIRAPERLLQFPRIGQRLSEFETSEVRELRIGKYVLRYQLLESDIMVLRFFHSRENRFWDPEE
jgi:plasmid stabilization system protein ParE